MQVIHGESPIPAQIRDEDELRQFFNKYRKALVPYAGTDKNSAHSLLAFLLSLKDLSPTEGAVLTSMKRAIFGGVVEIIGKVDPVFDIKSFDPSDSQKETFYDFITTEVQFFDLSDCKTNVRRFGEIAWEFVNEGGFIFAEIVHATVGGQTVTKVYLHHPLTTLFLLTKKREPRMVAISPIWSESYIQKKEPRVIPQFPFFVDEGKGVKRSMIMFGKGTNTWYPFPSNMPTMLHRFSEFQQADYVVKQTHGKFMGEVFLEVEADQTDGDPNNQTDPVAELHAAMNQDHTNRGTQPSSVIVSARPYGSKQAYVFQFNPNQNPAWYKTMSEVNRDYIIGGNNWSRKMLGLTEASGLTTNAFKDEFEVKNATVIQPVQLDISEVINTIVFNAASERGLNEMQQMSIRFNSPYKKLLEDEQEANNGNSSN